MKNREIHPWTMLPADYAGLVIFTIGYGFAIRAAVVQDAWLMIAAAGITTIGGALKVGSTRYKGRIDRERQARRQRDERDSG
jgi:hypothetical protein